MYLYIWSFMLPKLNWASSHDGSNVSRVHDPVGNAHQASACITFADVPLVKADAMRQWISQEYRYRKVWFIRFHFDNNLPSFNLRPQWFITSPYTKYTRHLLSTRGFIPTCHQLRSLWCHRQDQVWIWMRYFGWSTSWTKYSWPKMHIICPSHT